VSNPTRARVTRIVTGVRGGTAFAEADVPLELGDFAPPAPPMLRSEPVASARRRLDTRPYASGTAPFANASSAWTVCTVRRKPV